MSPFQVAKLVDGVGKFAARRLLELRDMNVADTGFDLVFQVDGGCGISSRTRSNVSGAAAPSRDTVEMNVCALWALEHVRHGCWCRGLWRACHQRIE